MLSERVAPLAAESGEAEWAARLFGAPDAAFQALGAQRSPSNRADYARGLAAAHAGNSQAAFRAAHAAGRALSLDEAAGEALSLGAPPPRLSLRRGRG